MSITENDTLQAGSTELLQWSVSYSEQETSVAFEGEIDLVSAETMNQVLNQVLAELGTAVLSPPTNLAIDMAKVTFLDSTGIRQLVVASNAASDIGCSLVVRHPTAMIERTLEICGLRDFLLEDADGDSPEGR